MDTFVPPGWMTRTEFVEGTGRALFKDKWLGAIPTTAELLQANPDLSDVLLPNWRRRAISRARAGHRDKSPKRVLSRQLAELLATQKSEEPEKAEMHARVIEVLREPLCSGTIRSGIKTRSGGIHELPPHFWQGDGAIPAFDTDEATHGRELQTPIGRVLTGAVTGRVLFKRDEAEAWLAGLEARRRPTVEVVRHEPEPPAMAVGNDEGLRTEVDAWYAERWVPVCRADNFIPTGEHDHKAAQRVFDRRGLRDLVRKARSKHAPEWSTSGPKKLDRKLNGRAQLEQAMNLAEKSKTWRPQ